MTHAFTFVLDHDPTDIEIDALFDAGCEDTTPETHAGLGWLHFDRDASSLGEALVSALHDVEAAGLTVVAVRSDDLVTLREIATRTSRTYESVRLLASGARGPGRFPPALSADGWSLYSWAQVQRWFTEAFGVVPEVTEYDRTIAAADHLIRARAILDGMDAGLAGLVA